MEQIIIFGSYLNTPCWSYVVSITLISLLVYQELLSALSRVKLQMICRYLNLGIILFLVPFAFMVISEVSEVLNGPL